MKALLNDLRRRSSLAEEGILESSLCEASLKVANAFLLRWRNPEDLNFKPSPVTQSRADRLNAKRELRSQRF